MAAEQIPSGSLLAIVAEVFDGLYAHRLECSVGGHLCRLCGKFEAVAAILLSIYQDPS